MLVKVGVPATDIRIEASCSCPVARRSVGRSRAPRKPIVTELGLIVGIDVVGLVLALLLWRQVSVRDAGPPAIRRLGGALERATRAFVWQEFRLIAAATFVLVVLAAGLSGVQGLGGGSRPGRFFLLPPRASQQN